MSTPTTNMGLLQATDADDSEHYLATDLPASLVKVDGHRHGGGTDGLAVKAIVADVVANRPAAATKGRVWYATDTGILSVDDAADWDDLVDVDSTQTLAGKTYAAPTFTGAVNGLAGGIVLLTTQQRSAIAPTVDGANHTNDLDVTVLTVPSGAHYVLLSMTMSSNGVGAIFGCTQQGLVPFVPYLQGVASVANLSYYVSGWVPVNLANNLVTAAYTVPVGQTPSTLYIYALGYIL